MALVGVKPQPGTPAYASGKPAAVLSGALAGERTPLTPLKPGDRVRHKTFGGGLVVGAVPTGGDVLLTIAFDSIGTKKLMQKFAKLEKE